MTGIDCAVYPYPLLKGLNGSVASSDNYTYRNVKTMGTAHG